MEPVRGVSVLVAGAILSAALLAACSPGVIDPDPSRTTAPPRDDLGAPGCDPTSPIGGDSVIEATGVGATTASGLLETTGTPDLAVGQPLKLVVQMSGSGDLTAGL